MLRRKETFHVNQRVQTVMGCQRNGVVCRPFGPPWTDGSYGSPAPGDVYVRWDDGTQGFWKPHYIKAEINRATLLG